MGYSNVIPGWLLEEMMKERAEKKKKRKGIKLSMRFASGKVIELPDFEWTTSFPKLGRLYGDGSDYDG